MNKENDIWHSLRGDNIGGSETAALFGESPYLSYYKLWAIKFGLIEPDNLDEEERIEAGNFIEPAAIAWYNKRNGTTFYQPKVYIKHKTVKGMACTPDAFDAENKNIMAQVKNVDSSEFHEKWQAEGRTIKKAPLHILLQCQHEMECADIDESILIVTVGGNRLYSMSIMRDREIGEMICEAVNKFWNTLHEPKPEFERDIETINKIRQTRLSKLLATVEEDLSFNKYLYKITRDVMKFNFKKKKLEDEINKITAEIIHLLGNAEVAKVKDVIIKLPRGKKTPSYISTKELF